MRIAYVFALSVGCADAPCGESAGPPLRVGDDTCVLVQAAAPGVKLMREPDSCAASAECLVLMPGETVYVYQPVFAGDGRVQSDPAPLLDGKCPLSCE